MQQLTAGEQLENCFTVLSANQSQIQFADTKAAFVFGINTLMFGFITCTVTELKTALVQPSIPIAAWFTLVPLVGFAACAVAATGFLIYAVMSRLGAHAPDSRVFFGHIALKYKRDYAKYTNELKNMTEDEWIGEVASQILETSHIACEKHRAVKNAAYCTIAGVALWAAAILASAFLPAAAAEGRSNPATTIQVGSDG